MCGETFPSRTRLVWISFRSNPLLVLSVLYVSVLLFAYVRYGIIVQLSLGIISLAVLPVTLVLGRTGRFLRELSPFLLILLAYEALEGLAGTVWVAPVVQIVGPRGMTSQSWVTIIQTTFYSPFLTQLTTIFYSLHFFLIIVSAVVLWYSNKFLYNGYMSSLVICAYVSLIVYILFPTSPPWYNGVATNLLQTSTVSNSQSLVPTLIKLGEMIESDKLAAFPSLHAAYAVLFCYFTMKARWIHGIVSVPIMIGVLFSTIYLGQHYLVDIMAGAGVAIASTFIAKRLVSVSLHARTSPSLTITLSLWLCYHLSSSRSSCSRTEWVYLPILFSRPSIGAVVQTTKEWGQHGLRASPDQRYWSRAPVIVGSNPTRPTTFEFTTS